MCSLSINWICHQYLISKKEDRYNKRENTYCEWQSDLSPRDRTFFSIKIHNGYYFSLQSILSSMYIIVIRNHFLWEPHMQIYFYWLYHIKKSLSHIVNCIGFNRWYYLLAAWVQGCRPPGGGRGAHAPSYFGRSVYPISTGWQIMPPT